MSSRKLAIDLLKGVTIVGGVFGGMIWMDCYVRQDCRYERNRKLGYCQPIQDKNKSKRSSAEIK